MASLEKMAGRLPDAISKRFVSFLQKVEVDEHHVGVYASKKDGRIIKADHPQALLHGSLVSQHRRNDYEWQVCECCSALSLDRGFPLWSLASHIKNGQSG